MSLINFGSKNKTETNAAMVTIPLDLPDVRVLETNINDQGEIIITVESTLEETTCKHCGKKINAFHQHDEWITMRHLSILGRPTFIRMRPKRYNCTHCARHKGKKKVTTTQQLPWHQAKNPQTRPYEEYILVQLINSTIKDVSLKEGLGYDEVEGIVERNIRSKVDWSELSSIGQLGVDEISLKKGHRDYVVIITARLSDNSLKILAVLPNRKKKTLKKFLRSIPKGLVETIESVCSDMWKHYIAAVEEVWGGKIPLTIDRYHVAKKYREAADKLRKKELRRLKKELSEEEYKQLKGHMWVFRKAELNANDKELLELLFFHSPALKQAYGFRKDLTAIFDKPLSKEEATKEIEVWCQKVEDSDLTCFDTFLTTLDNHFDYILNYFVNRHNSGFVEGFNNKIKVIKRRCYGIFNVDHLFQRIFLDLEGYSLFAGVA